MCLRKYKKNIPTLYASNMRKLNECVLIRWVHFDSSQDFWNIWKQLWTLANWIFSAQVLPQTSWFMVSKYHDLQKDLYK